MRLYAKMRTIHTEVEVTVDFCATIGTMGAVCRDGVHTVSTDVYHISPQAHQFVILIQKTQAVAIAQGFVGIDFHSEGIAPTDLTDVFAHRFRSKRRTYAFLSTIDEIVGEATVEGFLRVDIKCVVAMSV